MGNIAASSSAVWAFKLVLVPHTVYLQSRRPTLHVTSAATQWKAAAAETQVQPGRRALHCRMAVKQICWVHRKEHTEPGQQVSGIRCKRKKLLSQIQSQWRCHHMLCIMYHMSYVIHNMKNKNRRRDKEVVVEIRGEKSQISAARARGRRTVTR